jgi:hypothetical protein
MVRGSKDGVDRPRNIFAFGRIEVFRDCSVNQEWVWVIRGSAYTEDPQSSSNQSYGPCANESSGNPGSSYIGMSAERNPTPGKHTS